MKVILLSKSSRAEKLEGHTAGKVEHEGHTAGTVKLEGHTTGKVEPDREA